ncbi:MAG: hypothetical protein JWP66_102 [Naasia sp.]|nr:hypothetical protein [Naasia sp.]
MPDSLAVVQLTSGLLAFTAVLLVVTYLAAVLIGAATLSALVAVARPFVLLLAGRPPASLFVPQLRGLRVAGQPRGRHR